MVEAHVRCGTTQRQRIAILERDGHDSRRARNLLALFEEMQELHIARRDRLRALRVTKLAA